MNFNSLYSQHLLKLIKFLAYKFVLILTLLGGSFEAGLAEEWVKGELESSEEIETIVKVRTAVTRVQHVKLSRQQHDVLEMAQDPRPSATFRVPRPIHSLPHGHCAPLLC